MQWVKKTLLVAGSIAEGGFRLMRRASEDFAVAYGDLGRWKCMVDFPGMANRKQKTENSLKSLVIAIGDHELDLLCFDAALVLKDFYVGSRQLLTHGPQNYVSHQFQ